MQKTSLSNITQFTGIIIPHRPGRCFSQSTQPRNYANYDSRMVRNSVNLMRDDDSHKISHRSELANFLVTGRARTRRLTDGLLYYRATNIRNGINSIIWVPVIPQEYQMSYVRLILLACVPISCDIRKKVEVQEAA